MRKGTEYESESIALLNSVWFGSNFVKNTIRETSTYLTGLPDIITDEAIKKGKYTIEALKSTYKLTEEQEAQL